MGYSLNILFWSILGDLLTNIFKGDTVIKFIVGGIAIGYAILYFILSGKPQFGGASGNESSH